jgi:uncharacterized protein YjbJ (UPF0337 family)
MNWDQLEGNWKQFKGIVQQHRGRLTNDNVAVVAGKRHQLAGKTQETYGINKDAAHKQLCAWRKQQKNIIGPGA